MASNATPMNNSEHFVHSVTLLSLHGKTQRLGSSNVWYSGWCSMGSCIEGRWLQWHRWMCWGVWRWLVDRLMGSCVYLRLLVCGAGGGVYLKGCVWHHVHNHHHHHH